MDTEKKVDSLTWQSPNYSSRRAVPDSIVLHSTEGLYPSTASWLVNPRSEVSCHFLILRDGRIFQLVRLDKTAWHAGHSWYKDRTDWNVRSFGIEIEHVAGQNYPRPQLDSVIQVCRYLVQTYRIEKPMVVAHRWIVVPRGRREDPTNMSDAQLNALIGSFYAPLLVRPYRVKKTAIRGANIREKPNSKAKSIGSLWPASRPFRGTLVTDGEAVKGDARWVGRVKDEGGGYVWYGLLELV